MNTRYSQLSQSRHHYKADTSLRRTWLAGPNQSSFSYFYLMDLSIRQTARASPEGVCLRESSLYSNFGSLGAQQHSGSEKISSWHQFLFLKNKQTNSTIDYIWTCIYMPSRPVVVQLPQIILPETLISNFG